MNTNVLIFAGITFLSTIIGGSIALKLKKYLPYFFAFAAGSLIGVAFFDLLPEALVLAKETTISIRSVMLTTVIAFLIYSLIEKYSLTHPHHKEDHTHKMGEIGAGSLIVHSFIDGIAIGAAFQINPTIGFIVGIAVIFHDFTDGINTVILMLRHQKTIPQARAFLIGDALAPVLGVFVASIANIPTTGLVLILSFFTGEFLYIGASTLVPEIHKHHSRRIILAMIVGTAVIFTLTAFIQ